MLWRSRFTLRSMTSNPRPLHLLTRRDRDLTSQHIISADEAIGLGSIDQDGGNPYLNIGMLVKVALAARVDAIHPGYVYPGDKRSAKAYLREHGPDVPLIPGVTGSSQQAEELERLAGDVGYPVMLKASAGGGGKGMRIVHEAAHFREELQRAQSEASRFFGSSDCILEKYIESGKHIEIQIMGDRHGNVISLNERECSIQRRHQKVIEETPSPWLDAQKRNEMSEVAVRIGKLLNYENAGTVEFVFDVATGKFYFLEVNTRLQVEHPITEETTRLDLVALQIFVAAGGNLSSLERLQSIPQIGHAIECRLCAEDPARDFYPENGRIRYWRPATLSCDDGGTVRFETAVATGGQVSIHFDSMIAKIVVWAPTRAAARTKAIRALAETACIGLGTNQLFMQSCLLSSGFSDPGYTTSFIPERITSLCISPYEQSAKAIKASLPLAIAYILENLPSFLPKSTQTMSFSRVRPRFRNQGHDVFNSARRDTIVTTSTTSGDSTAYFCSWESDRSMGSRIQGLTSPLPDPEAPTGETAGVAARFNALSNAVRFGTLASQERRKVSILSCNAQITPTAYSGATWLIADLNVQVAGAAFKMSLATEHSDLTSTRITDTGQGMRVMCHVPLLGTWQSFDVFSVLSYFERLREAVEGGAEAKTRIVLAPMPCKVLSVLKADGDLVKAGERLLVVESMKMEVSIAAQVDGTFRPKVKELDAVDEGKPLCVVE
ncbi:hypothetical protein LTR86_007285 [Recurvomyces mirabilis]|nr:hypothetical protein LTR86_007285 [Recurvomyces mirabilis]